MLPDTAFMAQSQPVQDGGGRTVTWKGWFCYMVHCTISGGGGHLSCENTITVAAGLVWWRGMAAEIQR